LVVERWLWKLPEPLGPMLTFVADFVKLVGKDAGLVLFIFSSHVIIIT
jgi:hypothetical protein